MPAYKDIKRNKVDFKGKGYNKCLRKLNFLFCCGKMQRADYAEYLVRRKRDKQRYACLSLALKIPIFVVFFAFETYRDMVKQSFRVPPIYFLGIALLEL